MTQARQVGVLLLLGCIQLIPTWAAAQVRIDRTIPIPMRDGVNLSGSLYSPNPQTQPLPAIVLLTPYTPYNTNYFHAAAHHLAQNGYVALLVDSRGRGNSEGVSGLMHDDPRDGPDIIEWVARQPWCNGKVGMRGGSYSGYNQWATAKERPHGLSTIVPTAAAHPASDVFWDRGMIAPSVLTWLALVSGRVANWPLYEDRRFWQQKFGALYDRHLPFEKLDSVAGISHPKWREFLANPNQGAGLYWDSLVPTARDYNLLDMPVLSITGHFDTQNLETLEYYRRHMQHGTSAGKDRHFLVIGPWDHPGTREPKASCCRFTFGQAAMLDIHQLHKEWYDWVLKAGPSRPGFLADRVAYYAVGPEEWRYAPDLEAIPIRRDTLYLASDGRAADARHPGRLARSKALVSLPDTFVYDPLSNHPYDHLNDSLALGVLYESEPFARDAQLTGQVQLVLSLALNVVDTDFDVWLGEVTPDGRDAWWVSDALRARHRNSRIKEELVTPGRVERYVFDTFPWVSIRIRAGSRLRLAITSRNTPWVQKNYNSGGVIVQESGKDARRAVVRVFHDARHPAFVVIPIEQEKNPK